MVKVKYPNGKILHFMWTKGKYGYIRTSAKLLRYPLPAKKET